MSLPLPVLLVAHQSPPLGGPGVRRMASWMALWPSHGIEPLLLTAPAEDGARFHGYPIVAGTDGALAGRTVVRVATPRLPGLAGALARAFPPRVAWTLAHRALREPEVAWFRSAVRAGLALARDRGVRVVVSTSQPYEAHAVGRALAHALGVPWVADFRDPMAEAEGRAWPTRWHAAREAAEERRWFEDADRVWATCQAAANRWRQRFPESAAKVRLHRNGIGALPLDLPSDAGPVPPLRIGHVGRFTDSSRPSRLRAWEYRPGGDAGAGSSPGPLFAGLARFLERVPAARGQVTWVTVGDAGPLEPPEGVRREHHRPVPHEAAVRIAATCHALYLPLTRLPPTGGLFVQQKVYEYAALGRPVLVSGAARETTALLGPLARFGGQDDPAAMARELEALWRGEATRPPTPVPVPSQAEVAAATAAELHDLAARASG